VSERHTHLNIYDNNIHLRDLRFLQRLWWRF